MGETFFIADMHFGHDAILMYDKRPFRTIEEHDAELIKRWNNRVGAEDTVWILGDISKHGAQRTTEIMTELRGKKNLVVGNHDKRLLKHKPFVQQFNTITDYIELNDSPTHRIVLCHYPIPTFNGHLYGWYHLYGHVHNSREHNLMEELREKIDDMYDTPIFSRNVGCMMDYMKYTPRTTTEIFGF